jgi:hypothetical protein
MQLVRSRPNHILAVENITGRQSGTRITSNRVKQLDEAAVDQMCLPDNVALAVRANVAVITTLSAQINIVEKRLQDKVELHPEMPCLPDGHFVHALATRTRPRASPSASMKSCLHSRQ